MKLCSECGKKGLRMRASGKCWKCDPKTAASVVARAVGRKRSVATPADPPVIVWLRLQDDLRALNAAHADEDLQMRERQRQERADALAKIGAFERDNPSLADDARRQLENLAEKPPLGTAA